jgi:hypothetical protein
MEYRYWPMAFGTEKNVKETENRRKINGIKFRKLWEGFFRNPVWRDGYTVTI